MRTPATLQLVESGSETTAEQNPEIRSSPLAGTLPQPPPFSPSWLSKPVDSGANQCSRSSSFLGYSKVWDSSIDLVSVLKLEIRDGQLSFRGKGVLELRFNDTSWDLCLLEEPATRVSPDSFKTDSITIRSLLCWGLGRTACCVVRCEK